MWKNQSESNNAAFGYETMQENNGSNNTAFGKEALADSVNNNNCVAIGYKAGYGVHSSLLGTNGSTKITKMKMFQITQRTKLLLVLMHLVMVITQLY